MKLNIELDSKAQVAPETKEKLSFNVLAADDDKTNRSLCQELFNILGHKVKFVEDGQLLVDELLKGRESYDLVFSDNNMPRKKGIEALKEIHSIEKFRTIPFIISTTDPSLDGSLERHIAQLGGLYVPKVSSIEQLSKAIDKVMQ